MEFKAVQVEVELKETAKRLIEKTKKIQFKGNNKSLFDQAKSIWNKCDEYKRNKEWENAFYCAHLFLALALDHSLAWIKNSNPKFAGESNWVRQRLEVIEKLLELCVHGIREDIERKLSASTSVKGQAPPAYPGSSAGTVTIDGASLPVRTPQDASNALDALRLNGSPFGAKIDTTNLYSKVDGPLSKPVTEPSSSNVATGIVLTPAGLPLHSRVGENVNTTQMRIHKVTGDGHCAFRSIAQGQHKGTLDKSTEFEKALALRRCAAKALIERKNEDMTGTGLTVSQVVLMKDDQYSDFLEYVRGMSTNTYAGETEFWLLADEIKQPIAVFKQSDNGELEHMITYGEGSSNKPEISLLWQPGAYSDMGNHYDLLIEE